MDASPPVALLTAAQEAALVGELRGSSPVTAGVISRARQDPRHPACRKADGTRVDSRCTLVDTRGGPALGAPEDTVRAYWQARDQRAGGLTRTGRAALATIAAGGSVSPVIRRRLAAAGYLTADGTLTGAALAVLDPEPQEQQ